MIKENEFTGYLIIGTVITFGLISYIILTSNSGKAATSGFLYGLASQLALDSATGTVASHRARPAPIIRKK